jgi:hypothetical protein
MCNIAFVYLLSTGVHLLKIILLLLHFIYFGFLITLAKLGVKG